MSRLVWTSNAMSHVGSVRKMNEDAFLEEPTFGLWCVADGMGGHDRGDFASTLIVKKLKELISLTAILSVDDIEKAVLQANTEIFTLSKEWATKVGSTVAILFVEQEFAHLLWAGDSRVYRLRDNKLSRVTRDHNQAEELIQHGFLSPDQAEKYPGANLITRAVGTRQGLSLEHKALKWEGDDKFILCTDGLNCAMKDEDIEMHMLQNKFTSLSSSLINCALNRWALDNITVISVQNETQNSE